MFLYFFFGWGSFSLLNCAVAQLHGRNALLWFLLSALFGPLATLYLLFTYKKVL